MAVCGKKAGDTLHKPAGCLESSTGGLGAHFRAGAGLVVGYSLELVAAAEKRPVLHVDARVVLDEASNSPCTVACS